MAEKYIEALLKTGSPDIPTLSEYAQDMFDRDKSAYLKRRNELKQGRRISLETAANRHAHVNGYLIPQFGDTKLNKITLVDFEKWWMNLNIKNSTKNSIMYTLSLIMKEAVRQGIIEHSPLMGMEALDPNSKTRDYLRMEEVNRLFPAGTDEFQKVWGKNTGYGIILLIAASGGLRSGELRALRWRHVVWETGGVLVMKAQKKISGEGEPKAGSIRGVLLPEQTMTLLRWWYEINNEPGPEVHISPCLSSPPLFTALKKGMEKAEIDYSDRYLDVHSLRHTYNSHMRGLLDESNLMAFTGHRTVKMLEHYDQKTVAEKLQRRVGLRGQVDLFFTGQRGNANSLKLTGGNDIEQQ